MWLQHFSGWDKWEEKLETTPCSGHTPYVRSSAGTWSGGVFNAEGVGVESFRCVSTMGFTNTLIPEVITKRYAQRTPQPVTAILFVTPAHTHTHTQHRVCVLLIL